jgi:type I restriction enzyme R subunit
MLDTGIDIPEIVNLVFFKMVRSRTKFWQMVGRGTPYGQTCSVWGGTRREFWIFDYCQNLEFFSQNLGTTSGATNESLSKKLFAGRVELIAELDKHDAAVAKSVCAAKLRASAPGSCADEREQLHRPSQAQAGGKIRGRQGMGSPWR